MKKSQGDRSPEEKSGKSEEPDSTTRTTEKSERNSQNDQLRNLLDLTANNCIFCKEFIPNLNPQEFIRHLKLCTIVNPQPIFVGIPFSTWELPKMEGNQRSNDVPAARGRTLSMLLEEPPESLQINRVTPSTSRGIQNESSSSQSNFLSLSLSTPKRDQEENDSESSSSEDKDLPTEFPGTSFSLVQYDTADEGNSSHQEDAPKEMTSQSKQKPKNSENEKPAETKSRRPEDENSNISDISEAEPLELYAGSSTESQSEMDQESLTADEAPDYSKLETAIIGDSEAEASLGNAKCDTPAETEKRGNSPVNTENENSSENTNEEKSSYSPERENSTGNSENEKHENIQEKYKRKSKKKNHKKNTKQRKSQKSRKREMTPEESEKNISTETSEQDYSSESSKSGRSPGDTYSEKNSCYNSEKGNPTLESEKSQHSDNEKSNESKYTDKENLTQDDSENSEREQSPHNEETENNDKEKSKDNEATTSKEQPQDESENTDKEQSSQNDDKTENENSSQNEDNSDKENTSDNEDNADKDLSSQNEENTIQDEDTDKEHPSQDESENPDLDKEQSSQNDESNTDKGNSSQDESENNKNDHSPNINDSESTQKENSPEHDESETIQNGNSSDESKSVEYEILKNPDSKHFENTSGIEKISSPDESQNTISESSSEEINMESMEIEVGEIKIQENRECESEMIEDVEMEEITNSAENRGSSVSNQTNEFSHIHYKNGPKTKKFYEPKGARFRKKWMKSDSEIERDEFEEISNFIPTWARRKPKLFPTIDKMKSHADENGIESTSEMHPTSTTVENIVKTPEPVGWENSCKNVNDNGKRTYEKFEQDHNDNSLPIESIDPKGSQMWLRSSNVAAATSVKSSLGFSNNAKKLPLVNETAKAAKVSPLPKPKKKKLRKKKSRRRGSDPISDEDDMANYDTSKSGSEQNQNGIFPGPSWVSKLPKFVKKKNVKRRAKRPRLKPNTYPKYSRKDLESKVFKWMESVPNPVPPSTKENADESGQPEPSSTSVKLQQDIEEDNNMEISLDTSAQPSLPPENSSPSNRKVAPKTKGSLKEYPVIDLTCDSPDDQVSSKLAEPPKLNVACTITLIPHSDSDAGLKELRNEQEMEIEDAENEGAECTTDLNGQSMVENHEEAKTAAHEEIENEENYQAAIENGINEVQLAENNFGGGDKDEDILQMLNVVDIIDETRLSVQLAIWNIIRYLDNRFLNFLNDDDYSEFHLSPYAQQPKVDTTENNDTEEGSTSAVNEQGAIAASIPNDPAANLTQLKNVKVLTNSEGEKSTLTETELALHSKPLPGFKDLKQPTSLAPKLAESLSAISSQNTAFKSMPFMELPDNNFEPRSAAPEEFTLPVSALEPQSSYVSTISSQELTPAATALIPTPEFSEPTFTVTPPVLQIPTGSTPLPDLITDNLPTSTQDLQESALQVPIPELPIEYPQELYPSNLSYSAPVGPLRCIPEVQEPNMPISVSLPELSVRRVPKLLTTTSRFSPKEVSLRYFPELQVSAIPIPVLEQPQQTVSELPGFSSLTASLHGMPEESLLTVSPAERVRQNSTDLQAPFMPNSSPEWCLRNSEDLHGNFLPVISPGSRRNSVIFRFPPSCYQPGSLRNPEFRRRNSAEYPAICHPSLSLRYPEIRRRNSAEMPPICHLPVSLQTLPRESHFQPISPPGASVLTPQEQPQSSFPTFSLPEGTRRHYPQLPNSPPGFLRSVAFPPQVPESRIVPPLWDAANSELLPVKIEQYKNPLLPPHGADEQRPQTFYTHNSVSYSECESPSSSYAAYLRQNSQLPCSEAQRPQNYMNIAYPNGSLPIISTQRMEEVNQDTLSAFTSRLTATQDHSSRIIVATSPPPFVQPIQLPHQSFLAPNPTVYGSTSTTNESQYQLYPISQVVSCPTTVIHHGNTVRNTTNIYQASHIPTWTNPGIPASPSTTHIYRCHYNPTWNHIQQPPVVQPTPAQIPHHSLQMQAPIYFGNPCCPTNGNVAQVRPLPPPKRSRSMRNGQSSSKCDFAKKGRFDSF